MTGRLWLAVALSGWAALAPLCGGAEPRTVTLGTGESARFPLAALSDARAGAYLRGRLITEAVPMDLSLIDADGSHIRRLLDDNTGAQQFQLIVPKGEGLMLEIRSEGHDPAERAEVTLALDPAIDAATFIDTPIEIMSPRLRALAANLEAGGDTVAFWDQIAQEGTPMVEPSEVPGQQRVTFLWRGALRNVRLWGGPVNDHVWMSRLGDSDLWYASFDVPDTLRLIYGFAPDIPQFAGTARENRVALMATLQADPLNRFPVYANAPDIWAQRSGLTLANAPEQKGMNGPKPRQSGTRVTLEFTSEILANTRQVDLYTSVGFDPMDPEAVFLLLFDGPAYQTQRAPMPDVFDRLVDQGDLPPLAVAFVDPKDNRLRAQELPPNDRFVRAISEEFLPQVSEALNLTLTPARTVVAGSSYGGLAAAWFVHQRPDLFGNAVMLSPSLWWAPEGDDNVATPYMSRLWMEDMPENTRLWMSAGIYETSRGVGFGLLEATRHFADVLRAKGHPAISLREYAGGHDYAIWRGALADGLIALFGKP